MSPRPRRIASLAIALLSVAPTCVLAESAPHEDAAAVEFFEKKVRPILVDNCYGCHSANTNAKGGLRVDDRKGLIDGGVSGSAVVPGDVDTSLLIQAVRYADDGPQMPPNKKLSEEQIADLEKWVKDGAAWPKIDVPAVIGKPNAKYEELRQNHWAWQPLKSTTPPDVQNPAWVRDDVDRFILARLEAEQLAPVADADKLTLIRRLTFDLTGLPPTPEEIDAFLADESAQAVEAVVDRLLSSPAYGERWGRHWLDVARYGESTGSSRNVPYPHAWRYRDYVIHAVNNDKPYDQFVREQIAGDLLPAESPEQREEQLVATGFLALGVKDVNQRFKVRFVMDNIDEQIDTVSRSVLGLTVSCARCHDHKFDPIPTTDYYALAGIFQSTDLCAGVRNKMGGGGMDYYDSQMLVQLSAGDGPDEETLAKIEKAKRAVDQAKGNFEALRGKPEGDEPAPNGKPKRQVARQKLNRLQAELNALTDPAASGKVAIGVREAKTIADTEVRIRGEAEKLGPVVPRGFLSVVNISDPPTISVNQSGRLELAQWLTRADNPLTSRVMVNRIWHHLFGRGLVSSVDNFGVTGDVPSHPELLDHLAQRFVQEGWSVKELVRAIVLSHAYQLSSEASETHLNVDPANRLVWRHSPRRLDAEEIRDATLAAAGALNPSPIAASPAKELKVMEIRNNGAEARSLDEHTRGSKHRSVYLPLLRGLTPTSLEVFDFAEQGMVTGSRETTTVAPQALYLLNDPFVRRQSLNLADRLLANTATSDAQRIELAYRLTLGRSPSLHEIQRATNYLAEYEASYSQIVASAPTAVASKTAVLESDEGGVTDTSSSTEKQKPEEPTKPMPVIDPDQVITVDEPVKEEVVEAASSQSAAWASLCQALLGSAEFRYLR